MQVMMDDILQQMITSDIEVDIATQQIIDGIVGQQSIVCSESEDDIAMQHLMDGISVNQMLGVDAVDIAMQQMVDDISLQQSIEGNDVESDIAMQRMMDDIDLQQVIDGDDEVDVAIQQMIDDVAVEQIAGGSDIEDIAMQQMMDEIALQGGLESREGEDYENDVGMPWLMGSFDWGILAGGNYHALIQTMYAAIGSQSYQDDYEPDWYNDYYENNDYYTDGDDDYDDDGADGGDVDDDDDDDGDSDSDSDSDDDDDDDDDGDEDDDDDDDVIVMLGRTGGNDLENDDNDIQMQQIIENDIAMQAVAENRMITRRRSGRHQRVQDNDMEDETANNVTEDNETMDYEVDIPAEAIVVIDDDEDEDENSEPTDSEETIRRRNPRRNFIEDSEEIDDNAEQLGDSVLIDSPENNLKVDDNGTQTTPGLKENGPPEEQKVEKKEEVDEDESQMCPICFDAWTNSGSHRLASLNCGHLFGRSCIEQWMKEPRNRKCPQCKKPAKRKDIRNLYAQSLKVLDTTERDEAKKKATEEAYKRSKAEEGEAKAILQVQMLKAEMEKMKQQLLEEKTKQQLLEQKKESAANESDRQPKACAFSSSSVNQSTPTNWKSKVNVSQISSVCPSRFSTFTKKYSLRKSLQVAQKSARVMAYDKTSMMMVVSKPSPNQLFAGYGLLKVSSLEARSSEYIRIHQGTIRDAKFNHSGDQVIMTASVDKTIKLTNVLSNNTVLSYTCPSPVWACDWNKNDSNYIYAGLQNGACYMFDIRKLDDEVCSMRPQLGVPCPIVSLSYVTPGDSSSLLRCEGVLVGTLQGGWFMKKEDSTYTDLQMIFPEGSCAGISYEPHSNYCLLSQRPGKKSPTSVHQVCELVGDGTPGNPLRANVKKQCFGGNRAQSLTRSHLYPSPDDPSRLMLCAGDEASSSVIVWDGSRGEELQKLQCTGGTVFDVMTFDAYNAHFLASLTEQKLDFYQLQ